MGLYEDAVKRTLDVDDLHEGEEYRNESRRGRVRKLCGSTINKAKSSPGY